jgi:glycosyltransferase involved in cell wall biosynthesis
LAVKKRILEIIPTLDRAGAEKQLALLAAGLPADEFEVHVCALTRGGPLLEDLDRAGIPTTVIGKRWKIDPQAFFRLKRFVADWKPDLIHTWIFAANAYGRAAGMWCKVKCLVAGERCVDPWKGGRDLAIDRYLARRTAKIVTNSSGVKEFYKAHGLPPEKFVIIPNGILPPKPSTTPRDVLLDELGLPAGSRLIGLVGRLWAQKRVDDAIWAADLLKRVRDDTHLLILGDGPLGERLRRFRDKVEICDRVHFLGHRDDAWRIIPHFDVLWSTSAYEGQSNVIMEAMSHGVPVVATDIAGTRDLVVPDVTGRLVSATKADSERRRAAFAKHTQQLLEDPTLAAQMGAAAKTRMETEFTVEKMVAAHAELYRELLQ